MLRALRRPFPSRLCALLGVTAMLCVVALEVGAAWAGHGDGEAHGGATAHRIGSAHLADCLLGAEGEEVIQLAHCHPVAGDADAAHRLPAAGTARSWAALRVLPIDAAVMLGIAYEPPFRPPR